MRYDKELWKRKQDARAHRRAERFKQYHTFNLGELQKLGVKPLLNLRSHLFSRCLRAVEDNQRPVVKMALDGASIVELQGFIVEISIQRGWTVVGTGTE